MKLLSLALCASFLVMYISDAAVPPPPRSSLDAIGIACNYINQELQKPGSTYGLVSLYPEVTATLKKVRTFDADPRKRAEYCKGLYLEAGLKAPKPANYPSELELTKIGCDAIYAEEKTPGSLRNTRFKYPEPILVIRKAINSSRIPAKRSAYCKDLIAKLSV